MSFSAQNIIQKNIFLCIYFSTYLYEFTYYFVKCKLNRINNYIKTT